MHRYTLLWLNLLLSLVCIVVFIGSLVLVGLFNQWHFATGGAPGAALPFPYAVIVLAEAVLLLGTWIAFARWLRVTGTARWRVGWIGSLPLWGVGLLCWLGAGVIGVLEALHPNDSSPATVWVLGAVGLLAFLAAVACVLIVVWTKPRQAVAG